MQSRSFASTSSLLWRPSAYTRSGRRRPTDFPADFVEFAAHMKEEPERSLVQPGRLILREGRKVLQHRLQPELRSPWVRRARTAQHL